MAFASGDLAVGVGACQWVVERGEGGEEQGSLEDLVPATGRMLAPDGAARAADHRHQACIVGEMANSLEVLPGDSGEESGGDPDPDSGHPLRPTLATGTDYFLRSRA